jgi:uncharacterized protein
MTSIRVLNAWILTAHRVAVHEPTGTAVVADMHLGYSDARRARGDAVPLTAAGDELEPLRCAHAQLRFRRLLVAGDLFEKAYLAERYLELRAVLDKLAVEWVGLVPGNHDRRLAHRTEVAPLWPDGVRVGDWQIVHGDTDPAAVRRVMGHWHPCIRFERRKLPCYLVANDCLVLPAFSRDAAGVDVARDRRWDTFRRVVIAGERVVYV